MGNGKEEVNAVSNKRAEIDKAKHELEDAENNYDLERVLFCVMEQFHN